MAVLTAWLVAVHPVLVEFQALLYPEALMTPVAMLLAAFILSRDRAVDWRLIVVVGVVFGLGILVRPTSAHYGLLVLVAWIGSLGFWRGVRASLAVLGIGVLVVVPWSIRASAVAGGFVPLSIQDGAIYGTFNEEAANDPERPRAWRFELEDPPEVIERIAAGEDISEWELRQGAQEAAWDYIREHPGSVPRAMFWNGLVRTWDLRPMAHVLEDARFQGRAPRMARAGALLHWALLPLVVAGGAVVWRRDPWVVGAVAATVLGSFAVFAAVGTTRYRAPVTPLLPVFAATAIVAGVKGLRAPR